MLKAKKSLGQNFLVNPHIIERIVSAAEISKDDTVLEVGPGTGNLTKELVKKAGKVIAIEKDSQLIEPLKETFESSANVEIIEGDILKLDISNIVKTSYKVVANIPYNITSILIRKIFEEWPSPEVIVLTIQKEVAQRIIAKPPHMNILALSVQYYSEPEIITYISKNNFRPVPKIDSAIIKLTPRHRTNDIEQTEKLFKIMKAGFSEKRKQLAGNLSKQLKIPKEGAVKSLIQIGLKPTARAEELSLENWVDLAKIILVN